MEGEEKNNKKRSTKQQKRVIFVVSVGCFREKRKGGEKKDRQALKLSFCNAPSFFLLLGLLLTHACW